MAKRPPPQHARNQRSSSAKTAPTDSLPGRNGLIISHYGQTLDIEDDAGELHRCTARKKLDSLVCGDKVVWQTTATGEGVVVALQARQTLLVRPDNRGALKPIAANVDQLLVVTAPQPDSEALIDTALIDRYLVAAELSRLQAVIVINKVDLLNKAQLEQVTQLLEGYRRIAYPVLFTSAKQGHGIEAMMTTLTGHTSVFSGPSGVGKSSLVKAVLPEREIRIGAVSAASGAGRHTTTLATLYHLPHGGSLIDSPGVRDFGLWHADPADLARGFVEFQRFAPSCRFADCLHLAEPDCAVREAVATGVIDAARYDSYRRIAESLQN